MSATKRPIILVLISLLGGCSGEPGPPEGHAFIKALPSDDFSTLALRFLGDPERGPELAALNRVSEEVGPAGIEGLIAPPGARDEQPPLFDTLEEGGGEAAWLAASRLTARGELSGAVGLLEKALRDNPYQPRLRFLLGLLRFRSGEAWRAAVQLRAAAYLAPADSRPHLALSLLHAVADRMSEARRELAVALALEPGDDRAWALAAMLAAAQGDKKEAEFLLEEYLRIGPTYGTERETYAAMLELIGRGLDPLEITRRSGGLPDQDRRAPHLDPPQ